MQSNRKPSTHQKGHEHHSALCSRTTRRPFILTLKYITIGFFAFFFLVWTAVSTIRTIGVPRMPSFTQSTSIEHLWAQYSPYFPVTKYSPPPRDCKISQVSMSDKRSRPDLIYPWPRLISYVYWATCLSCLFKIL